MPFSDLPDNYSISQPEFGTTSTKYHLSTHSQNNFDGKFQSRNLKNTLKEFSVPQGLIFNQKGNEKNYSEFFTSKPKAEVSKILLTALADRAPPFQFGL